MTDAQQPPPSGGTSERDREREWVERARQGDSQAFGQLYQSHVDRVYSYVLFRVRDRSIAEDLTQEVFIQALRSMGAFDWRGALAPWLLRIARNTVIDHWRKQGRRNERSLSAVEADEEGAGDSRIDRLVSEEAELAIAFAERAIDRDQIGRVAEQLTELQQQVLALRFASGMSVRETAEAMDRSEGAVKNLQHHALKILRRKLAKEHEKDA
jgi:RNA polymerase sigma-70 factor (ECF subfamily)